MKETQEFSNGVGPDSGQSSVAVGVFVPRILRELNSNGAKYEGHSKAQKSFKKKKKKKSGTMTWLFIQDGSLAEQITSIRSAELLNPRRPQAIHQFPSLLPLPL